MTTKDKLRINFDKRLFEDSQAFHQKQHDKTLAFEKYLDSLVEVDGHTIDAYFYDFSPNSDRYIARVLDLDGYEKVTTGKTREEAIANMQQEIAKFKMEQTNGQIMGLD